MINDLLVPLPSEINEELIPFLDDRIGSYVAGLQIAEHFTTGQVEDRSVSGASYGAFEDDASF
jgi:hypothetical protein